MFTNALLLIVCSLSFGNLSKADGMYHKEYYETGGTKAEGWIYKGIKTGYWRFYHSSGKISEQGYYHDNQRIKYWYFYSSKGEKISEGHYRNNKRVKWWLFFDRNGKINHKCQLLNDIKNGYCLMYDNTKLTSAEKYKNGKKIKEWFSFISFRRENNLSDLK